MKATIPVRIGVGEIIREKSMPNRAHTCSITGCGGRIEARGWCKKHYRRWQRHGDPTFEAPSAPSRRTRMTGPLYGTFEPPTCDHPRTVDQRTWSDPGPVVVCLDCGHTINADRPTHPPKPPRIQTRKVNGL